METAAIRVLKASIALMLSFGDRQLMDMLVNFHLWHLGVLSILLGARVTGDP